MLQRADPMRLRVASCLLVVLFGCGADSVGSSESAIEVPACLDVPAGPAAGALDDEAGRAEVTAEGGPCARSFTFTTTADRRDNLPENPRTVREGGRASVATGNPLFDGLFQLALEEARENSVSAIRDWSFRNGAPVECPPAGCFETGRKWNYVWTRDTAYSASLGLGFVDPARAAASLEFKLSARRDGTDLQIVQDTGTGGSYPVSTDRVTWALGAREILRHLTGPARTAFRDRALEAITNTAEQDRYAVRDPADGLYRGEQSFLDWRAQTYPEWTVPDLALIASSKTLSTNVAHLALLETGRELAEEVGDAARASTFAARAEELRLAIRRTFWLPEDHGFSTYLTTDLDAAPARRFDLLGTALAILFDVATPEQAKDAIAHYPILRHGAPVVFPQQQDTAIYHNRAIWPFVTAFALSASKKVGNDAAFDAHLRSLVRGSALFLSNMENLEVVTGKPFVEDGAFSGPVVNSQRQLWSVAGYVGAVVSGLFGVETRHDGIHVAPFVPKATRRALFANTDALALNDVPVAGKKVSVLLKLPADSDGSGAYRAARVVVNGKKVAKDGDVAFAALAARNLIVVELEDASPGQSIQLLEDTSNWQTLYGPRTPSVSVETVADGVAVDVWTSEDDVALDIYRDGVRVAEGLPGGTRRWIDETATDRSHCYTVDARFASGTVSQRAKPACLWGEGRIVTIPSSSFDVVGGQPVNAYGRFFHEFWGDPGHVLSATFHAARSGETLVQATYGNGAGGLDTGITCAVKRVVVEDAATGEVVGDGPLVMPQRGDWSRWGESSFVRANLREGREYRVRLEHDARATNMSAFQHFADYTGGTGGQSGAFFRVNVAELKILSLE